MKTTAECLDLLRGYYETVASKHGVKRMALFGSVARGEQQDGSDVDVAYEGEPNLFLRVRMKMDLEKIFGCSVDIVRLRSQFAGTLFGKELEKDLIYV